MCAQRATVLRMTAKPRFNRVGTIIGGGLALSLGLAGCAMQKPAPLAQDLPAEFEGDRADGTAGPRPSKDWYREFGSDELNALMDIAAHNNWDVAAARARVAQADARARQAGAAILPSVDATSNANFLAGHSSQGGGHELDWSAMLSASYELDFWGKNRATAQSARLLAGASRADRDTIALTTLAGVANGYFQILALRERLAIAHDNDAAAHQLLQVVQARCDAGIATPVELATQKATYDAAQIAIVDLKQTEFEARAALSLLLGRAPERFDVSVKALGELHEPVVNAGLPSELLTRRPDIALAESNLRAGHADLAAARAAMFPAISLTAGAGVQNPALPATVLTIPGIGPSFALGANLLQPIFDHGRLKAQRDEVSAKEEELLAGYRSVIVSALVDVENALAEIHHLDVARGFQVENVAQSERAFDGAKLRYQAGSGDYLTLLEAQRTLYVARDQLVQYRLARLTALVSFNKAMGGGWTQDPASDAKPTTMTGNLTR
jgi:outer membrane protein, multidrug efflux system